MRDWLLRLLCLQELDDCASESRLHGRHNVVPARTRFAVLTIDTTGAFVEKVQLEFDVELAARRLIVAGLLDSDHYLQGGGIVSGNLGVLIVSAMEFLVTLGPKSIGPNAN